MAKGDEITTKFRVDISDLKKGISEANKQIRQANAEFKAAAAGMDNWSKSSDGINAKLKQLNSLLSQETSKLSNYKSQMLELQKAYNENGRRADELRSKLQQLANQGVSKTSAEYKKYQSALTQVEKEQTANKKAISDLNITLTNQQGTINGIQKDIKNYTKALDDLGNEAEEAGKKAKESGDGFTIMKGVIANLSSQAITSAVNALKSMGSALVDVGKQAIASYAEFEQLVGGVETLFKDSAPIVQKYADNAYKTAGLSANEYMETVTSFSASLLQSLGGDTEKAAKYGDMAITDMADNANKMGTNIGMIQNAYQGFAKQNYTMLD